MEDTPRKPYPADVTDDEWAFLAPYLTLMDSVLMLMRQQSKRWAMRES